MTEEPESQDAHPRATQPKFLTQKRFGEFNLSEPLLSGLDDAGFTHCTPIQAQVLPLSLSGKDVAGQAQTGTGKTAAFLVTILTRLLESPRENRELPSALVVAPTRELAYQIYDEAMVLGRHTGFSMVRVVGGVDYQKQADALKDGPDIVIGTPGRLIDFYKQKIFKTDDIKVVVVDEADRLLDLGFAKDMRYILSKLPHFTKRQSMLFSATLSYRVMELTYEYMNLPEFVSVTPEEVTVEGIEQALYHVGNESKLPLLLGLLARENWSRLLIFANTKAGVIWLDRKLRGNDYPSEGITGDLPQQKRFQLMEKFKSGQVRILIATDVASRGIHVEDISHVINYDLPQDPENYIHRIGRTARAGKSGRAISLACEKYVFHLEAIEDLLGAKIPVEWFEEGWMVADKAGPIKMAPKERKRRAAPRRRGEEGPRKERAGEGPRKERTGEGPRKERAPRQAEASLWTGTYPGAFFGFAPPAAQVPSLAAAPVEEKPAYGEPEPGEPESMGPESMGSEPMGSEPGEPEPMGPEPGEPAPGGQAAGDEAAPEAPAKKQRRRRRKKKSAPKGGPPAETAKGGPPAETAKE